MKRKERNVGKQLYVGAETLAAMLECGRASADKIGRAAGARVEFGRVVRYNVQAVNDYLMGGRA